LTRLKSALRFAAGTAGRHLSSAEALAWLRPAREADDPEFAWLRFDLAGNATEKWLREHLTLPDAFHEALQEGARSTRVEYADGSLVGVINNVWSPRQTKSGPITTRSTTEAAPLLSRFDSHQTAPFRIDHHDSSPERRNDATAPSVG